MVTCHNNGGAFSPRSGKVVQFNNSDVLVNVNKAKNQDLDGKKAQQRFDGGVKTMRQALETDVICRISAASSPNVVEVTPAGGEWLPGTPPLPLCDDEDIVDSPVECESSDVNVKSTSTINLKKYVCSLRSRDLKDLESPYVRDYSDPLPLAEENAEISAFMLSKIVSISGGALPGTPPLCDDKDIFESESSDNIKKNDGQKSPMENLYEYYNDRSPWETYSFPHQLLSEFLTFNSFKDNLNLAFAFPNITMMKALAFKHLIVGKEDGLHKNIGVAISLDGSSEITNMTFHAGDEALLFVDEAHKLAIYEIKIYSNGSHFRTLEEDGMDRTIFDSDQNRAFAGLTKDGRVFTWGRPSYGGDGHNIVNNVKEIHCTIKAFAALRFDNSVFTWGSHYHGGDSTEVSELLKNNVEKIVSTNSAFTVLKHDKSVVTWGNARDGGDSRLVQHRFQNRVIDIFSNSSAFAVLKDDGNVVTWGNKKKGGVIPSDVYIFDVVKLASSAGAFAALQSDGSVVTWGDPMYGGGTSSLMECEISSEVVKVVGTHFGFEVTKTNGQILKISYATR